MTYQQTDTYSNIEYTIFQDDDYPIYYWTIHIEDGCDCDEDYDTIEDAEDACIGKIESLLDKACGCYEDHD